MSKTLYGNIYRVNDTVCMKVSKVSLKYEAFDNPVEEINTLRKLCHPHIVKWIADSQEEDTVSLQMEYVPQGDLMSHLQTGIRLSEKEALHLLKQLHSAIVYLQDLKLVHLDLSPENIGVRSVQAKIPVDVVLLDMGSVRNIDTFQFEEKRLPGKLGYQDPDMIDAFLKARRPYNPVESQVWSLGVMLYMMLTGNPPYARIGDAWYKLIVNGNWIKPTMLLELFNRSHQPIFSILLSLSPRMKELIDRMIKPKSSRIKLMEIQI